MFQRFSTAVSAAAGSAYAFSGAVLIVIVWAITGPIFGFSDTWQLVINTGTTIVTFLMVFLIQNSQNRDVRALHLKLDELLVSSPEAHDIYAHIEGVDAATLDQLQEALHRRRTALVPHDQER
jgi:low affinity Fe/Cu permease